MSEKKARGRPKNAAKAGEPSTVKVPGKSTEQPSCSKATNSAFSVVKSNLILMIFFSFIFYRFQGTTYNSAATPLCRDEAQKDQTELSQASLIFVINVF